MEIAAILKALARIGAAIGAFWPHIKALWAKVRTSFKGLLAWIEMSRSYRVLDSWRHDPREFYVKDAIVWAVVVALFSWGGIAVLREHDAAAARHACSVKLWGNESRLRAAAHLIDDCAAQMTVLDRDLQTCLAWGPVIAPEPTAPVTAKKSKRKTTKPVDKGYVGPFPW